VRSVVLEQPDLGPLGIGLQLESRRSTMSFPLGSAQPLLRDLHPEDLSFWAGDNYITRHEIIRPDSNGALAVAVTGGENWLKYAPIVDMPFGRGRFVCVQMIAGEKRLVEPAAAKLIENAIAYLAAFKPAEDSPTKVIAGDGNFNALLDRIGLITSKSAAPAKLLILQGGGDDVTSQAQSIAQTLQRGGTVCWHAPTPEAFESLAKTLGAQDVELKIADSGASILDRGNPLLRGISREDILRTSKVSGWDRPMRLSSNAAWGYLQSRSPVKMIPLPLGDADLDGVDSANGKLRFSEDGHADFTVHRSVPGVYRVHVDAGGASPDDGVIVKVDGVETTWGTFGPGGGFDSQIALKEQSIVAIAPLRHRDGSAAGAVSISQAPALDPGFKCLTLPASLVVWSNGNGRVVIDTIAWDQPWEGPADPLRFANGLFANLGARFREPGAN
jgi:hypothetical protein